MGKPVAANDLRPENWSSGVEMREWIVVGVGVPSSRRNKRLQPTRAFGAPMKAGACGRYISVCQGFVPVGAGG